MKHSPIGASSMSRWSKCPGSVRLSVGLESRTSSYAAEGTVGHEIAEQRLRHPTVAPLSFLGKGFIIDGHKITVDEEMVEAVQVYLDEVLSGPKTAARHIEHRFDLSKIHPGLFGTADYVRFDHTSKLLTITDFKYGAGLAVEVKNNPQLLYYSLGALLTCGYPADEVEMVIVQPRCPHRDGPVRRHRIPVIELLDFTTDLIDYAKATEDADAPLHPGDHCRFCPAAATCPALHARVQATAAEVFGVGQSYDPSKLADTLTWLPVLEAWIKNTREFAYAEAEQGKAIPGWKLVDKVARRKWRDVVAAELALKALGLGEVSLYPEPELRSPAQMEKILHKDQRGVLDELTVKESSGHTLALESDKRPAVTRESAADVFASV